MPRLFEDNPRIFDAAFSLAKLMAQHRKPIVFHIDRYMELVAGIGVKDASPEIQALFNIADTVAITGQQAAEIMRMMNDRKMLSDLRRQFVEAINDAFSFNKVIEVCGCVMTEIGQTDTYPTLGEANVYAVFLVPNNESEVFVLDL